MNNNNNNDDDDNVNKMDELISYSSDGESFDDQKAC